MPPAGVDEEESGRRTYLRERSWSDFSVLPFEEDRKYGAGEKKRMRRTRRTRKRKRKRKRKRTSEIDGEERGKKNSVRNSQERKH